MSVGSSDFFQRQEDARRNTGRLIFLFMVAVLALSCGTYIAIALAMGVNDHGAGFFDPMLMVVSLVVTGAFIFAGSAYKISALNDGGSAVAESLGGVEVDSSTSDPLQRRLVNVVEEMSLASGTPVPRIYVLEQEQGINAFAAGYSVNDAAVAVTKGCLEQLNRDELQGVIAHEFSHILNGDMRLNIRLIGVVHGILLMYLAGRVLVRTMSGGRRSRSSKNNGGHLVLAGLALMLFGAAGLYCGRLIKSAVSRQREYLADAAAVQFTRNPMGLAGALKKIGGYQHGSALQSDNAEEVSHMCFSNVLGDRISGLSGRMMATHPSLVERIRLLDPSFNGEFAAIEGDQRLALAGSSNVSALASGTASPAGGAGASPAMALASGSMMAGEVSAGGNDWSAAQRELNYSLSPDSVIESVGKTSPQRLVYCATLLDEMPHSLMQARSNLLGAISAVYTILLDEDIEQRRIQGAMLKRYADNAVVEEARRLWPAVATLDEEFRLPYLDLLFPTLRRMTWEQYRQFSSMVDRLIMADGQVVLKEFVVQKVLLHRLDLAFSNPGRKIVQFKSISGLTGDISVLLSGLAHMGHEDINDAAVSFDGGRGRIPARHAGAIEFLAEGEWDFIQIDAALDRLAVAAPKIKKVVIDACAYCVMGDGKVTFEEVEILRSVCEALDVPLPPFIPEATRRR